MKVEVKDIKRVIKDIQKLNIDLKKIGMLSTPDIIGFYGEFLVWKEFKSRFGWRGYHIEFGSGQSKADIVLIKGNERINIEVKTSRLKKEWFGLGYGFAINIKKCKKDPSKIFTHFKRGRIKGDFCYFDFIVAVSLLDNLGASYYIIPRKFIEENEENLRNKNKRFSSGTHRIIFIEKESGSEEITNFDRKMRKLKSRFKNAWHLIK